MKIVHPESHQTQTSAKSDDSDQRGAPAARVPDGVTAPDQMVVILDGRREPFAYARYVEPDASVMEVKVCPTGEHLPGLAKALRTMADNFEALYGAFCQKRQARVDAMRMTAEHMVRSLRATDLSEDEQQQVFKALGLSRNVHDNYDDHNGEFPF